MKIDKNDVLKALKSISIPGEEKNIIESKAVINVMTFGDQIDVDLKLKKSNSTGKKKN
jgi:ATP-binding protein involved in chromosome partitioning